MRVLQRLALLLLAYVALDFANPLMPGAVSFDPDDSVEAVRAAHARAADASVATVPACRPQCFESTDEIRRVPRVTPATRSPRERLGHHRRAPAPPSPPLSEDH